MILFIVFMSDVLRSALAFIMPGFMARFFASFLIIFVSFGLMPWVFERFGKKN